MMWRTYRAAIIATPVVAASLYGLQQYKSKKRLYVSLSFPEPSGVYCGLFSRLRNVIYRNTLQDRIWDYVEEHSKVGNAETVLAAFDEYCYNYEWTYAIGDRKAPILAQVVQESSPNVALEVGTFLGYSAIVIARSMPPTGKIITVEANQTNADIAKKMIQRAGFGDNVCSVVESKKVTVANGQSRDVIPVLRHKFNIGTLDFVFLDHNKGEYLGDIHQLETCGYLSSGSVVFADNVEDKEASGFREYIRNSGNYESTFYHSETQYVDDGISDGMERAIFKGSKLCSEP